METTGSWIWVGCNTNILLASILRDTNDQRRKEHLLARERIRGLTFHGTWAQFRGEIAQVSMEGHSHSQLQQLIRWKSHPISSFPCHRPASSHILPETPSECSYWLALGTPNPTMITKSKLTSPLHKPSNYSRGNRKSRNMSENGTCIQKGTVQIKYDCGYLSLWKWILHGSGNVLWMYVLGACVGWEGRGRI